ncbi:MAG: serine hydrolase [Candidatus Symbiothrix sp.]|jgi:beta-glucosidase-like glycosyl hydrolase/CubicO group peptidase (beta-lactamase class C family)|nr:serine hydrolase [Candidatus Symbiothrix sp.]
MNKKGLYGVLFFIVFNSTFLPAQTTLYRSAAPNPMEHWADSVFDSLNQDERIGQLFMITTDPLPAYRNKVLKYIREQKIGGILFSKGSPEEEAAAINTYQAASRTPLFISFDGEWGLAMRLENTPLFPKNMMIGAIRDNEWVRLYGREVGRELKELGAHINFAPVLDVNGNPDNPVIGTRSYGELPDEVAEKGNAYAKGLESENIIAVGKHFPGHGDTSEDSHKSLPLVKHDRSRLDRVELYPFARYIREGFAGIMTGHLSVPALDAQPGLPSSLSPPVVSGLLRQELGFQGLIFTDALAMKGASGGKQNVCVRAILAGNDILLNPPDPAAGFEAVKEALKTGVLSWKTIEEKCLKILRYKYIAGLHNNKPVKTSGLQDRINSAYARRLVRKLNEEAITLLKNENGNIPLNRLGKRKIAVLSWGEDNLTPFQKMFKLYGRFQFFQLPENAPDSLISSVFGQLGNYDAVICGIHSQKRNDSVALSTLCAQKEVHLCFFTTPYLLCKYGNSLFAARSVSLAYENTEEAQKAAAEVILGGLPAKGKLPVTIAGLFACGSGLTTEKTRLSYHYPEEVNMRAGILQRIDKIVEEGIEKQAFPGCQVLVAKDGIVVYHKSFGYFDYAGTHPVQNTDIYDLASVTKAIATLPAVMKLYDTKKIDLNHPLSRYIPELTHTDKSKISIKDALFHQTGLPAFLPFYLLLIDTASYQGALFSRKRDLTYRIQYDKNTFARTDFEFLPQMVSASPGEGMKRQVAENFYIRDDFDKTILREIVQAPLQKANRYLYSDLNFMLLKEMVENSSGQSLNSFLEREFFAGLGTSHTSFLPLQKFASKDIAPTENDPFLRNQILIGYPHDEAAALMGGVSGNAGLFSNTNDLAKILQMFLNGGIYGGERYLSESTARTFTQTKSPVSHRGLGFDKPAKNRSAALPASVFGHTGYTGTCFWVDPDNRLIYIFLSNRVYPSRLHTQLMELDIRNRIQDVIYEAIKNN